MPVMNFDLEDGLDPVSFTLKHENAERFMAFMQHCYDLEQTLASLRLSSSEVEYERDALAAHVGRLTSVAEKIRTVAPEYLDHLAADADFVLRDAPAASLARQKLLWQAEELESLRSQDCENFEPNSAEYNRAIGYNRCVEQALQTASALRRHAGEPVA